MTVLETIRRERLAMALRSECQELAAIEGVRRGRDERGAYIKPFTRGIAARAEETGWPRGSYPHRVNVLARAFQHVVAMDNSGPRRFANLDDPMDLIIDEVMRLIRSRWARR